MKTAKKKLPPDFRMRSDEEKNKFFQGAYEVGLTSEPNPAMMSDEDYTDLDRALWTSEQNWAIIRGWEDRAKKEGRLVGRVISHQVADGHANYVVTKENARTVRVEHLYLGDGYMFPTWGRGCNVSKKWAKDHIEKEDHFEEWWKQAVAESQDAKATYTGGK